MKRIKFFVIAVLIISILGIFSKVVYGASVSNNISNNKEINKTDTNNETNENNKSNNTINTNIYNTEVNNAISNNNNKTNTNTNNTTNTINNTNATENSTNSNNITKDNNTKVNENTNNSDSKVKARAVEKVEEKVVEKKSEENQISVQSNDVNQVGVKYRTHVQDVGWQNYVQNGATAGTSGKSLRLEALNIQLQGLDNVKVKYQVHVQDIGWQNYVQNGTMAGTSGRSLRLEAIKIRLEQSEDYSIMYRVHVQNIGWQEWKTDGDIAGTVGKSLRLEAIQIKIVPKVKKGKIYLDTAKNGSTINSTSSIKVNGWKMSNISNNIIKVFIDGSSTPIDQKLITYTKRNDVISAIEGYGTSIENPNPGFSFNINVSNMKNGKHTIKIVLYTPNNQYIQQIVSTINLDKSLHVQYKSHIQNIGWQNWTRDGNTAGTTGRALRVEALNISLINAPANAKIIYRTHVQNIGWQNWQSNGGTAGTQGKSLRVEAVQIKLENMDNYTVEYQVHIQNIGWTGWYIDGETAGTVGRSLRIEAIRIRIVPKYKRQYKGIDVSQYNGIVNWAQVKRDGIDFAFIRVGFRGYGKVGNFREDATFKQNIVAAQKAGIPVGIYFVTQATTYQEAIEEANWVANKIKGYNIKYPVALDIESPGLENPNDIPRTQHLSKNTRTDLAKAFCQRIQTLGYTPMIYTNVNWANNYLIMSQLSQYDTWIASYRSGNPGYSGKYSIWQYTSQGKVNGILGNVDMNISYKKY